MSIDQLTFTSSTNTLTASDVYNTLTAHAAIHAPSWYASSPFHATFASNITHIAANCFKDKNVKTVILNYCRRYSPGKRRLRPLYKHSK